MNTYLQCNSVREELNSKSLVIAGLARDCEVYLKSLLPFFASFQQHFKSVRYVFVENDSLDNTKGLLGAFNPGNTSIICLDGLHHITERTKRIEIARNAYLELIRNTAELRSADFLMVCDLDGVLKNLHLNMFLDQFMLIAHHEADAIFPNTLPDYYDLWALRTKGICEVDVFQDFAAHLVSGGNASDSFLGSKMPLSFSKTEGLIPVKSAFGGIGIYNMQTIVNSACEYVGTHLVSFKDQRNQVFYSMAQVCEHVAFHQGLGELGAKLCINPKFVINDQYRISLQIEAQLIDAYKDFSGNPIFRPK